MPGLTQTLEIARRALITQQAVMGVIGQNIANVQTPGYSRQVADLTTTAPLRLPGLQWGTGVTLQAIERRRDQFADLQLRGELAASGWWQSRSTVLTGIEALVGEPSENGLGAALDAFWAAWSELSNSPETTSLRSGVQAAAVTLTERFRSLAGRLAGSGEDLDAEISSGVADLNQRLAILADLNRRITASELGGSSANDLRDQRDLLLDELCTRASVSWSEAPDGTLSVRLGGRIVLDANGARTIEAQAGALGDGRRGVIPALADGTPLAIEGGRLGALLELREEFLPDLEARLDTLAQGVRDAVNRLHQTGPSGIAFFTGSGAADLGLDARLVRDPTLIDVSSSGLAGDNDIALAIAQLRDAPLFAGETATVGETWAALVSDLGRASAEAQLQEESSALSCEAFALRREATKGVSLDEEMTNLVQTQNAFLAATRLFEVTNEMFEALLAM